MTNAHYNRASAAISRILDAEGRGARSRLARRLHLAPNRVYDALGYYKRPGTLRLLADALGVAL